MNTTDKKIEAELLVYANFGKAYAKSMAAQAATAKPEDRKVAAAAIVATSYATSETNKASINRTDAMQGREVVEKAYGKRSQDVAAVLSGRVAGYDLPKSVGGTKDLSKLSAMAQDLSQQATREAYAGRGIVQSLGPRSDALVKVAGKEAQTVEKLTAHMLHVKAAIDAGVDHKEFSSEQGEALYKRFENAAFDVSPNNALKSEEFTRFEKTNLDDLKLTVHKEVEDRYAQQRENIERAKTKEPVISAEKVKEYSESKEFADTVEKVTAGLGEQGYPVHDPKFKESVKGHLLQEYAKGRKLESGTVQEVVRVEEVKEQVIEGRSR
ncbi:MAG TPA: hypothetical protein VIE65_12820 [Methylobacter sp.]|jgi:hypothetical protein